MTKYKCNIIRHHMRSNLVQKFVTLKVSKLQSVFKYVKHLNNRYIKKNIRYTIQFVDNDE